MKITKNSIAQIVQIVWKRIQLGKTLGGISV